VQRPASRGQFARAFVSILVSAVTVEMVKTAAAQTSDSRCGGRPLPHQAARGLGGNEVEDGPLQLLQHLLWTQEVRREMVEARKKSSCRPRGSKIVLPLQDTTTDRFPRTT
jgi:hypothetical protein